MNTLLIGARASGKTELGRRLAARRGAAFVDLDDVVLASFREDTVEAVWSAHGEEAWRRAEDAALCEVLDSDGQVVALGGGTPVIPDARRRIEAARSSGLAWVVYLQCGDQTLAGRLRANPGDRPSLTGAGVAEEIAEIRRRREPIYLALADVVYEVDDRVDAETAVEGLDRLLFGSMPRSGQARRADGPESAQ